MASRQGGGPVLLIQGGREKRGEMGRLYLPKLIQKKRRGGVETINATPFGKKRGVPAGLLSDPQRKRKGASIK